MAHHHTDTLAVSVGDSFQRTLDNFFGFIPNIVAFLVILLIGWIVAKVVAKAVRALGQKAGLDRQLQQSEARRYVDAVLPGASPSNGIARVVFWIVFAFFFFSAVGALKIPALTTFMNDVLAYLPNIIVAILIFVVAAVISGVAAAGITRVMGDTPTGKVAASVVPALVMVIALFMILDQLRIAEDIVQIAFAATMFALALGLALAFGLGGRPVAQRMLEDAYSAGRRHREQIKDDLRTGRQRAEADVRAAHAHVGANQSPGSGYHTGHTGDYPTPSGPGTSIPTSEESSRDYPSPNDRHN